VSRKAAKRVLICISSEELVNGSALAISSLSTAMLSFVSALIPAPLVDYVNRIIVFHCDHHRLEDVYVPAVSYPQAHNFVCFRHQSPAQRNPQIPG
jgi:hypothetical protein